MANEITALKRDLSGNLSVLLYYPIPSGVKVAGVIPTPSATVPTGITLTAQENTDLDAGDAMFTVVKIGMANGETPAQTLARLRARYVQNTQRLLDWYERRFEFFGQRFDK